MIGGISGAGAYFGGYTYAYSPLSRQSVQGAQDARQSPGTQSARGLTGTLSARRASSPEAPVEPVRPVTPTDADAKGAGDLGLPLLRQGADPVEMAVRMRIQYTDPTAEAAGPELPEQGTESVREAAEEGECQTCRERKYQDGSDDPGVSFKTPTRVAPELAASAVRGHESEHVTREQAEARREGRKVVSQSVTYHTAICPECGKTYVSGGTTRTVTAAQEEEPAQQDSAREDENRTPFSAVA